jgi:putative membrane protein
MTHPGYLRALAILFAAWWALLAIAPWYREDWLVENVLTVLAVGFLAVTRNRFVLSRLSYTFIFLFLCLHTLGSHYTYSEVPLDAWLQAAFGTDTRALLGWERNNFDRVVHFAYGLLLAYPVRELFVRVADVRGFWGYFLPLDLTMSSSMLYELIEWGAAIVLGGELGAAYLGTQGDVWDAHKDMALASLGALIAMSITAAVNIRMRRDFAREFRESLRVKDPQPLGEAALDRLLHPTQHQDGPTSGV